MVSLFKIPWKLTELTLFSREWLKKVKKAKNDGKKSKMKPIRKIILKC